MAHQPPSEKWHFKNIRLSHAKKFICCALTIRYIIYSTVGRSIASISDTGGIFTLALRTSVNMAPWVRHRGYGPPYHTTYKTNAHALTLHMSWDVRQARLHVSHALIPSIRCPRPTYTLICIYSTQIVRNERETTKDRLS